jgi:putative tricarboxylic transport membrane protein
MLENFMDAFELVFAIRVLAALAVGVTVGYCVGAMPGLTSSIGMALLIPLTFDLDAISAIVMLVAIYMAADYAAGIPAILVNAPGQPAAAVTAFDGYPMTARGEAGKALNLSIMSSAVGAFISLILLVITAQGMARAALAFGPAEYFALAVLGLSLIAVLSGGSSLKAMIGLIFGLVIVTVGIDPIRGTLRFVVTPLMIDGIPFLPALIGLFALSEVFFMLDRGNTKVASGLPSLRATPSLRALWPFRRTVLRSSLIGYVIGVIPGAGASIASLVSYGYAKRSAKPADRDSYGKGNPDGVVASETANNAACSGALAPLLALGVPGSASAAVLIGGLTIQGIQPGPMLFVNNPEVPYSIFVSLLVGLPLMTAIGLFGVPLWVRLTRIPTGVVATVVASICILGAYASSNNSFEVLVTVSFGIIGYFLRKIDIHPAPIVLALVLGYMMESSLRRSMIMANDNLLFILSKPIAAMLLLGALVVLVSPMLGRSKK